MAILVVWLVMLEFPTKPEEKAKDKAKPKGKEVAEKVDKSPKKDLTIPAPTTAKPKPKPKHRTSSLVKKTIEDTERAGRAGKDVTVETKLAFGKDAEIAEAGVEDEEALDKVARFEEVRLRMEKAELEKVKDDLAREKRNAIAIQDQMSALKEYIRRSETSLTLMKTDQNPGVIRRGQIESFERGLVTSNEKLMKLRKDFNEVSDKINQLQQLVDNPEKIIRRYTDEKTVETEE